jgi:anti-sigma B factor antagonist
MLADPCDGVVSSWGSFDEIRGRNFLTVSSEPASVRDIESFDDSLASQPGPPEVEHRTIGAVAAVQVSGELDLATAGMLEAKVERALKQGSAPLLIDFTSCGFIDSTVLSLLVDLRVRVNSGRRFAVVAQNQPLQVLRLTALDRQIPVFGSVSEALRALEVAASD